MNTLITGAQASGKSALAAMMKKAYESKGESCQIIEDTPTDSFDKHQKMREKAMFQIRKTKGNPHGHTICVTQLPPMPVSSILMDADRHSMMEELNNFDYLIRCERMG